MAGMKEDFYRRIGTDYHNRRTESFIYRYVRQEKEANLRIRLVQEYQAWRSNPEDGARFEKFLLTAVCGDKNQTGDWADCSDAYTDGTGRHRFPGG